MKPIAVFLMLSALFAAGDGACQGNNLMYSGALIVSSTEQTVPADKVWKVTAVYGSDRYCVPCEFPKHITSSSWCISSRYVDFTGSSFFVNGNEVISERVWLAPFNNKKLIFNDAACTSIYHNPLVTDYGGWGLIDVAPNPNMLPMWLAAGTTLKSATANVYLSVLEFDVVP
jgi:hypothetical protein